MGYSLQNSLEYFHLSSKPVRTESIDLLGEFVLSNDQTEPPVNTQYWPAASNSYVSPIFTEAGIATL